MYPCGNCDDTFDTVADLTKHRSSKHKQIEPATLEVPSLVAVISSDSKVSPSLSHLNPNFRMDPHVVVRLQEKVDNLAEGTAWLKNDQRSFQKRNNHNLFLVVLCFVLLTAVFCYVLYVVVTKDDDDMWGVNENLSGVREDLQNLSAAVLEKSAQVSLMKFHIKRLSEKMGAQDNQLSQNFASLKAYLINSTAEKISYNRPGFNYDLKPIDTDQNSQVQDDKTRLGVEKILMLAGDDSLILDQMNRGPWQEEASREETVQKEGSQEEKLQVEEESAFVDSMANSENRTFTSLIHVLKMLSKKNKVQENSFTLLLPNLDFNSKYSLLETNFKFANGAPYLCKVGHVVHPSETRAAVEIFRTDPIWLRFILRSRLEWPVANHAILLLLDTSDPTPDTNVFFTQLRIGKVLDPGTSEERISFDFFKINNTIIEDFHKETQSNEKQPTVGFLFYNSP